MHACIYIYICVCVCVCVCVCIYVCSCAHVRKRKWVCTCITFLPSLKRLHITQRVIKIRVSPVGIANTYSQDDCRGRSSSPGRVNNFQFSISSNSLSSGYREILPNERSGSGVKLRHMDITFLHNNQPYT
jgi:hypothetical protein